MTQAIDVSFDFRVDTRAGGDPDALSPTLRRYHRALWGRELPTGQHFELEDVYPDGYLLHRSGLGEFFLSSDSIIPTFSHWVRMKRIIDQIPKDERDDFLATAYTIGGMMVWPSVPKGGQRTINVERGFNSKIGDRMDRTLECVMRHYSGGESPMSGVLDAYADFFAVFGTFSGFVDCFLFQDLVTDDYKAVRHLTPFEDFNTPARPKGLDEYLGYREATYSFIHARNARIAGLGLQV